MAAHELSEFSVMDLNLPAGEQTASQPVITPSSPSKF